MAVEKGLMMTIEMETDKAHSTNTTGNGDNPMLAFNQAAENNKEPIGTILAETFSSCRHVLEIASGTAQHAVHMGKLLPRITWQTSDLAENLDDIRARLKAEASDNVRPPIELDVAHNPWPVTGIDAVYASNAVHIMSWDHVKAMFAGLDNALAENGVLALYGPYKYDGEFTTKSNAQFDHWLKQNNPTSGIRDFEAVNKLARGIGLTLLKDHQMPANNQLLVWQRSGS